GRASWCGPGPEIVHASAQPAKQRRGVRSLVVANFRTRRHREARVADGGFQPLAALLVVLLDGQRHRMTALDQTSQRLEERLDDCFLFGDEQKTHQGAAVSASWLTTG